MIIFDLTYWNLTNVKGDNLNSTQGCVVITFDCNN